MKDQALYNTALEMLRSENPYDKKAEELKYGTNTHHPVSLCALLQSKLEDLHFSTDRRNGMKINIQTCFNAICLSLSDYLRGYPAVYSYKQNVQKVFLTWAERIAERYQPADTKHLLILETDRGERSTAVVLLKELQNREGVTKKLIQEKTHLEPRTILKDLCRIDPSLMENPEKEYPPFYLGDQPVRAEITTFRNPGDREKRFRTVNSIHPLVLQENLSQVYILLQSLALMYTEKEMNSAIPIAADIWFQLTEYAQDRIQALAEKESEDFRTFLDIVSDDFPDHKPSFLTERKMTEVTDMSTSDLLLFCTKVGERRCDITIQQDSIPAVFRNALIRKVDIDTYKAYGEDYTVTFSRWDVRNIELV